MHNHVVRHDHFFHDTFKVSILTRRVKRKNSTIFYCTAQFQIQLPKLSNLFQSKITDTNERFDMWVWICAKKVMIEVLKEAWRKILYSISNISSQLVFLILWWDFLKLQMTTVFSITLLNALLALLKILPLEITRNSSTGTELWHQITSKYRMSADLSAQLLNPLPYLESKLQIAHYWYHKFLFWNPEWNQFF